MSDPGGEASSYPCRPPVEEDCVLVEMAFSAVRHREEKRRKQREAVQTLLSGMSSSFSDEFSLPINGCRSKMRSVPSLTVLSPSTFLLETFNAAEWVYVHRKRRKMQKEKRARRHRSLPVRASSSCSRSHARFQNRGHVVLGQVGRKTLAPLGSLMCKAVWAWSKLLIRMIKT
jgi:hypothetical protein